MIKSNNFINYMISKCYMSMLFFIVVLFFSSCTKSNFNGSKLYWQNHWIERNEVYINHPQTLIETYPYLYKIYSDSIISKLLHTNERIVFNEFINLGYKLRVDLFHEKDSALKNYFRNIGIYDEYEMIGIIFKSFRRYLKGEIFDLKNEVKMRKLYLHDHTMNILEHDSIKARYTSPLWFRGNTEYKRSKELQNTLDLLSKYNTKLFDIKPTNGFEVHLNCYLQLFMKKKFGDTISIWTDGIISSISQNEIEKYLNFPEYGKTLYISNISPNGDITLNDMQNTIFIHRNDSLFLNYENQFIFHPKLFSSANIVTPKLKNDKKNTLELDNTWLRNGLRCYNICINNKCGNDKTRFCFTFDENINFINWENCKHNNFILFNMN